LNGNATGLAGTRHPSESAFDKSWKMKLAVGMASFLLTISHAALANPVDGRVVVGSAVIGQTGSTLTVNQSSSRAIIEWQQFSIDTGELTRFNQPSSDAAALNRVMGGNPSSILGRLEANGKLYLINPNGVVVGPGGRIEAQSFLASTLDVSNAEFLTGGAMRFSGDSEATVINLGHIEAAGGDVYLLARTVRNEGEIKASGVAGLAGANDVLLVPNGNERLSVRVTGTAGHVTNSGRIEAAQAELKAAGGNPFALAINQGGVVRATGFTLGDDGRVVLTAVQGQTVVDGVIEAPGGRVDVLGDAVTVSGRVDASGQRGGGDINIGGDYQGEGTLKLARNARITDTATIRADGLGNAHGGQIVVWSEEHTVVDGQLSARGGATGGDGGLIETSSRGLLEFSVSADVSAPAGAGGTWLLDPEDIDIGEDEAGHIEVTLNDGGNVHVKTAEDGDEEGNINVNAPITKSAGDDSELTLTAHNDVNINAPITNTSKDGTLDVKVNAGHGSSKPDTAGTSEPSVDSAAMAGAPVPEGTQSENIIAGEPLPADTGTQGLVDHSGSMAQTTTSSNTGSETPFQSETMDSAVAEADDVVAETSDVDTAAAGAVSESIGPSLIVGADIVTGGGRITLDNSRAESGTVTVDAGLDASSATGMGGKIEVLGDTVTLTDNAEVDASGATGGGTVHIGGAYQGGGDTPAAQHTTVAEGATIKANATGTGDGGEVVVWADRTTEFRGNIEAKGITGGAGGLVEVSGKQDLLFRGNVDTGGGTLLLDPENVVVSNAGGSTITPGDLVLQLAANNVILDTSGAGVDVGTLTVDDDVFYSSTFDLTLLAHSHVNFNASVQNRNEFGGDINIVAGWDGATAFDLATFTAEDVTTTTLFGNGEGSVNVGDGNQTTGIAVGSRSGATNVFAHDLNITAGNGDDGRFAQLGFQATDGVALDGTDLGGTPNDGSDDPVTGTIRAHVVNDIIAMGGSTDEFNYAQLGHVGMDQVEFNSTVDAAADAEIHVIAGSDLGFIGGSGKHAYAHLGHGGGHAHGNHSGSITITDASDLIFTAGDGDRAYAHLGHGGDEAGGDFSGAITITRANDLTFRAGTAVDTYARLGHGGDGRDADTAHSGDITIIEANNLNFTGGSRTDAYAQLGHGGVSADGNHNGNITITQANDLNFTGGSDRTNTYAQLGHGGRNADGNHSGNITITQANDLNFIGGDVGGGNPFDNYAQLGHGGDDVDGNLAGRYLDCERA
jgi:filamentous hemagglutinin family protein